MASAIENLVTSGRNGMRSTKTVLIDDINGQPAEETVKFALDGVVYEIDLTKENAEKMREQMRVWTDAGTRIGGRRVQGTPRGQTESAKIRAWAREQGLEVTKRGRIPTSIRDSYYAAH